MAAATTGGGGGNTPIAIPNILPFLTMSAKTIQNFVYSAQTPLQITLAANFNANSQALYEFQIVKIGYDTMTFTCSTLNASTTPPTYYLASGYHDIQRSWDNTTNTPVYIHSGVTGVGLPFAVWPQQIFGFYTYGEAYINGIALLANKYFDNTINNSIYQATQALNTSHFTNAAGTYAADFKSAPIAIIPETGQYYSPQTKAQEAYLMIQPGVFATNVSQYRSFDFRTGTTAGYSTYYTYLYNYHANWLWSYASMFASGATNHTTGPSLKLSDYLQTGNGTYGITSQGIIGTTPTPLAETNNLGRVLKIGTSGSFPYYTLTLKSATPGVPFEVKNIIQQRNTVTGGTAFETIYYLVKHPNEIANVTINQGNNYMGGFSLTKP